MTTIPFISTDRELFTSVAALLEDGQHETPVLHILDHPWQAIDYLSIEMPDLLFINFSDRGLDASEVLDAIVTDPWLLHGGIIGFCDDQETVRRLEKSTKANIIVFLTREELSQDLPLVMGIIQANRRLLHQRAIGSDLIRNISGHFKLHNDPLEASCYSNLICNFLYNSNRIDADTKHGLKLSIHEMLMNGIEHGNCGISSGEKTTWLESGRSIMELIDHRCRDLEIAEKQVTFEYALTPTRSEFLIADEGEGFDWRNANSQSPDLLKAHGRGIMMTRAVTQNLRYNEKGNEVRFEVLHRDDEANATPAFLTNMAPLEVKEGDIIFRQGEAGHFLYYIVKGQFDVIVNGRRVETLTPEDLFVGEMSFLLNHRRSATVRAKSEGRLIEITRR